MIALPWVKRSPVLLEALTVYGRVQIQSNVLSPFFRTVRDRQMTFGFAVSVDGKRKGWFSNLDHAYRCAEGYVEMESSSIIERNRK